MSATIEAIFVAGLAMAFCLQTAGIQESSPASLERKLYGSWKGDGPCSGLLITNADGKYHRRNYSPGNDSLEGNWQLKWDKLPPTLILTCESSDNPSRVGQVQELLVTRLDDPHLQLASRRKSTSQAQSQEQDREQLDKFRRSNR